MSNVNSDAPGVRIIPPLVYLAGLVIGLLASRWMPTGVVPDPPAWIIGGILIACGVGLAGSAVASFRNTGTTFRPDRAASRLVITGPFKITRNPMYLGMALAYLGITIAAQSVWALILFPAVLIIIQRRAIEPDEAFLARRFGADYASYKARVRRWL